MARNFIDESIIEQAAMYALGMLSQSEARAFDCGLDENREGYAEELAAFNAVTAALAFGAPEQTPPARARERLLARVAAETGPKAQRKVETQSAAPPQFRNVRLNEGRWDQVGKGAFVKILFVDQHKGAVTSLIKLEPGARLPRHRHLGIEESIVIEGDCRVNGEILMPGDYRCALAGTIDSEVTTVNGTTFMMIAPQEVEIMEPHTTMLQ
ncbi:MAG: cupin domain-containing protein [Blastocatellia bacterium]